MSTSHDGPFRDKTPRRTTRRSTATPIRDVSPPRSTHAASTALQGTPATRRSTRAASKRPDQPGDTVNNDVLPEIQTRQSYAYGSSKTPLLPEQLHVRDTLTMKQVADQMDTAINRAEQNLDTHVADLEEGRKQQQTQTGKGRVTKRTSKEPSPPASVTTEVQKKQRTAAWASSLDSGQLEDIPEEEQPQLDTPETRRTEPSDFPSGIFDQSYQYERGLRPPRKPPNPSKRPLGKRLGAGLGVVFDRSMSSLIQLQQACNILSRAVGNWVSRLSKSILNIIYELPDSRIVSIVTKTFLAMLLAGFMSYILCFGYTRFLCNPASTSRVSHTIESWCGTCQSSPSYIDLPIGSQLDINKLTSALKHIDTQIRNIESRVNSRLDSKVSALHTDIDSLRKEQSNLIQQLEYVSSRASQRTTSAEIASPLIPKINYFSPANGAIVNVKITSPTRQAPMALSLRLLTRAFGVQKYKAHNPITALEPWHDVGDCWCAAATAPEQDRIRLGVGVRELIFPTEMVVEHLPKDESVMPETAPKRMELWADFIHLNHQQWKDLGVEAMTRGHDARENPFGKTFGLIASVEYDLKARTGHVQRFALDVNQYGELKYSAMDFAVRVRSTYGGEHGCLYRIRLHGVPVEKKGIPGSNTNTEHETVIDEDEVLS